MLLAHRRKRWLDRSRNRRLAGRISRQPLRGRINGIFSGLDPIFSRAARIHAGNQQLPTCAKTRRSQR
jgi:hypothetical protein